MVYPVLPRTKFLIPRRGADILPRPHLIARLERALGRRLILISTPPGYGKTTLLAEFVATSDLPHAWCQLDAADSDPVIFLSSFIESLRHLRQVPDADGEPIGHAALALLSNMEANLAITPERVLTVLINELVERIDRTWLVVLEDYHEIANPAVHELVERLLHNAPPGLTLLISTRSDPPFSLARLRARGMLAEFRAVDLRFTEDEVRRWLSDRLPEASPEDALALNDKTEGWVAGLQLVLSSLSGQNPPSLSQVIANIRGTHHHLFEYLASEVFERQPLATRQFLLYSSVLIQMNAALCSALPGVSDAQRMLDQLERHNLFVTSLDENHEWYRYHHLFREFLLGKLRRDAPDRFIALHTAAGRYFESQGEWEAAAYHYLEGGALEAAASILVRLAPKHIEHGRVVVLQRHLSRLPKAIIRKHPELLLYRGDVLRRLGYAAEAVRCYEEARQIFEASSDRVWVSRALVRLGEIARAQGNYARAQALVTAALEQIPEAHHGDRARALIALAKSTGFLTGMDQGRALAEQALVEARLAGHEISLLTSANLLQSLGQICWWHGDPQSTVRFCSEALQTAPGELSPIAAKAYTSIAIPYLYWGHLDTALKYAERGLEIAQQLELQELLPNAYAILGSILTRLGETARAENALRQSLELAQRLGLAAYERVMATGFLAYNLYTQGRVNEAWQLAEGALWSYAGNPDTYEVYVCRSVLADIALERNQIEQAEKLFEDLLEVGERRQFRIPLAMVAFGLAYIYLSTGREAEGIEFARRSLHLIEPTGALQLYLDQGERARIVCRALVKAGVDSPFVSRVLGKLQESRMTGSVSVHSRAVSVKCLGQFRVYVNGEEVKQERWVSAKARDLLAYFVTFRRDRLPLDRILEALWPQTAVQSHRAFHTALYRVRQALRSDSESTKFILVEAGEYWLDAARFQIDVDDFDTALAQARAAESQNPARAVAWYERAISLYEGAYLDNFYYDWVFPEQRRLQNAYLSALRRLATYSASARDYERALSLYQRILSIDPLLEQVHCELMRCYAATGDRTGVVRQFRTLEDILQQELGLPPQPSTVQLYRALIER